MKYSYNWLKELSGIKLSPEKAVERLTMHSFEIEGMEKIGKSFPGVVVGKILEIKKHPNADKLQITRVDVGAGRDLSIVCGAPNIKVGDKVPVALVGTKLPGGEIKEAEIRGQKSFGMLCAADELGLGKDHSGIIILDKSAKVGESVDKYLGINDTVIEIKVLPDRAHDALSHVGVAREIAALQGEKMAYDFEGLRMPVGTRFIASNNKLSVQIKDRDLCSRYIGAVMTNIEIKESPKWMKDRLEVCGMNAINNVVDATNYVMLELGQPLHAFDIEKIPNKTIVVRRAKNKEKVELLDGDIKELSENDLLITNGEIPLALAGIKGGLNSGITENTKTIVLEAASFNATNIRKTRTRLGIKTDASDRFEKDIDPNLAEKAMARVIEILEHITEGKLEGIVDVYPKKVMPWKIKLNLDYVNSLLGEIIPAKNIIKILNSLDITTMKALRASRLRLLEPKSLVCEIPTFRLDLRTQEDLIEEIGRIYGYEKIKPQPIVEAIVPPKINEQVFFETAVKDNMAGLGYSEVYNYSFYSAHDADICGLGNIKHLELANPQNPDQQLVRVSLVPNMIKNIRENLKNFSDIKIFEAGRVYYPNNGRIEENRMLAMAEVISSDKSADTFYILKGAVESFLKANGINEAAFSNKNINVPGIAHPTRFAKITINGDVIGGIGEINPLVLEQYKIKKRVAMAELDLEILRKYASKEKTYKPLPKYPIVTRDISLLDKSKLTVIEISDFIKKTGGNLVLSVELFDTFQKDGATSHAFHVSLGADRTLEGKEVDEVMGKIIHELEKELKVEVRK
jgi:phenylalanyl-tRNA synthetase beta chain